MQVSAGLAGIDTSVEVQMPDLSNMTYAEAQKVLADLGIYLSKEAEVYDLAVAKDKIIYQSIPEGNMLHQGDGVAVTVSLGKEQVRVPFVQYETEEVARQMLTESGLLTEVVYEYSETVKKGIVISQETDKDILVDVGSKVKIYVSSGVEVVENVEIKEEEKQWSGWVDVLPAGVTADNYIIETKIQYSRRDKTVITSSDSTLASQGWTLENTETIYGQYGDWSAWTTTPPAASDTVEVSAPSTQYNYQYYTWENKEGYSIPDGYSQYNAEVKWGKEQNVWTNPGNNTDTLKVISYTPPVTEKVWEYNHYLSPGGTVISPIDYGGYEEHPYKNTTRLSVLASGNVSGAPTYDGYTCTSCGRDWWYNEGFSQRTVQDEYWTVRYGTWYYYYHRLVENGQSGWGAAQTESETCKLIGTQQIYQYRERTISYNYTYSQWSGWSGYSDTPVSPSATTEVQTKTIYRYKEK